MKNPGGVDREFSDLFAAYERALKRGGFLRLDRQDTQADWTAFAAALGIEFFDEMRNKKLADTLKPTCLSPEG
jgi:hypothetical protein